MQITVAQVHSVQLCFSCCCFQCVICDGLTHSFNPHYSRLSHTHRHTHMPPAEAPSLRKHAHSIRRWLICRCKCHCSCSLCSCWSITTTDYRLCFRARGRGSGGRWKGIMGNEGLFLLEWGTWGMQEHWCSTLILLSEAEDVLFTCCLTQHSDRKWCISSDTTS